MGKSAGNYLPFIFGSGSRLPAMQLPITSGDVISGYATSGDATSGDVTIPAKPPQMRLELCPYTT